MFQKMSEEEEMNWQINRALASGKLKTELVISSIWNNKDLPILDKMAELWTVISFLMEYSFKQSNDMSNILAKDILKKLDVRYTSVSKMRKKADKFDKVWKLVIDERDKQKKEIKKAKKNIPRVKAMAIKEFCEGLIKLMEKVRG